MLITDEIRLTYMSIKLVKILQDPKLIPNIKGKDGQTHKINLQVTAESAVLSQTGGISTILIEPNNADTREC